MRTYSIIVGFGVNISYTWNVNPLHALRRKRGSRVVYRLFIVAVVVVVHAVVAPFDTGVVGVVAVVAATASFAPFGRRQFV